MDEYGMASISTVLIMYTYILLSASKLYIGPYIMVIMVHVCCKIMISSQGVKFDQKALSVGLLLFYTTVKEGWGYQRGFGIPKICNNPSVVKDFGLCREEHCIVELCKVTWNTQQVMQYSNSPHKFLSLLHVVLLTT